MVTFPSNLSDRTHFVKINWTSSDHHTFRLGVPQGSPFGRLLNFLNYLHWVTLPGHWFALLLGNLLLFLLIEIFPEGL